MSTAERPRRDYERPSRKDAMNPTNRRDAMNSKRNTDGGFGLCPHCHKHDGIINVGQGHWIVCHEHKVKWFIGSNLFDSSRHQTEEEQRQIYDDLGIGTYKELSLAAVSDDD
jgi:hypothetical protein